MITKVIVQGLDDVIRSLDSKSFLNDLKKEMGDISNELDVRIDANAPILSGGLRENLAHSDPEIMQETVFVDFGVKDLKYEVIAIRLHEQPFQLGPVSKIQPSTVEGGIGSKYIERVFNYHALDILTRLTNTITESIKRKFNARDR